MSIVDAGIGAIGGLRVLNFDFSSHDTHIHQEGGDNSRFTASPTDNSTDINSGSDTFEGNTGMNK
jgi:hypothetical protein